MQFDVSVALTWVLFLALFPISFYWLRRAWRIGVRRDYSEVALKGGEAPPNPRKWAPFELLINATGGLVLVGTILAIVAGALDYASWSAIAGSTIWCKFFASFALGRHAHAFAVRAKG
ncbi:MAG: hypothetical protein KF788_06640 [Piscinibacter sp.]|nr:hypothetical protein [Piscinibacter sp.]